MIPHRYPIQVYYEDTDMGGIVYHANYLRYIERARSDFVRQLGQDQNAMREAGVVWAVRRIEADYLSTAKFEDRLEVETTVHAVSGVRLVMDQIVRRGLHVFGWQTHASSSGASRIAKIVIRALRGFDGIFPAIFVNY